MAWGRHNPDFQVADRPHQKSQPVKLGSPLSRHRSSASSDLKFFSSLMLVEILWDKIVQILYELYPNNNISNKEKGRERTNKETK